ncbi:cell division protein ZapE [Algiphilus sp.]|uniref:cell division protein ZapE n=1 Tax=Algiphilus sp. TaxID=1872431 RepID=UPI0025C5B604|nr:cell division protein ZapE [Algiphilus sp.]MCK5769424.1 AFG1 family ATPase [Algiphilus sp.]
MSGDSPQTRYREALGAGRLQADDAQARAVEALEAVHAELVARPGSGSRGGLLRRRRSGWPAVTGLYLWGGVGRGKTLLMDDFYASLPFEEKRRTHFHRFMLGVHAERRRYLDEQDPVALIAEELARTTRVLCFDEFFVSDIADAMILGRLTEVLFREGVTLVATSNVAPDDLYRDGLQRARFLPAIDRIKTHCRVMELASPTDFRLRTLERLPLYVHPCDEAALQSLSEEFDELAPARTQGRVTLQINGRPIEALGAVDDVAWFSFAELCRTARAASDYIALAREYQTILLSEVPRMDAELDESARRFVHLVDEFYDRNVKLVIAADVPLDELYAGKRLTFEFQRTRSRLTEMQSRDYLGRPHQPL